MKKEEINDLSKKLTILKQNNPLKFAELKGRIDAMYDMHADDLDRNKVQK